MKGWFNPRDWSPRDPDRGCLIILILFVAIGVSIVGTVQLT